ncbi:unnamed protein product [Kuraishia capsulata CBS 1993]|uniref:Pore membrane protein of 33 kDa n=1 Tax=Kuraishia capsulata CBS 1993 TaxID=1382522 RepID=W6MIS0_9ASCO|nr:uncharacterized protein KUCA_T00001803001 [Kuraishia capsulata CBS 1993]CDK25833.1 unnamed protein product [Kuraishia capsulata CBS 1993]
MSQTPKPSAQPKAVIPPTIKDVVNTTQFAWFIGHAITLFSGTFYFLTYRAGGQFNSFCFGLLFLSVVESFGIILYQEYLMGSLSLQPLALLTDDNVQYVALALAFLTILPSVVFAVVPFMIFAVFHILSYSRSTLFPVFGVPSESKISVFVANFVQTHHDKSVYIGSTFELITLVWFLLGALLWRKGYWLGLLIYAYFIKLRYDKSIITRSVLKSWEVKVDGLVSHPSVPVQVKSTWLQLKQLLKQFGGPALDSDASAARD